MENDIGATQAVFIIQRGAVQLISFSLHLLKSASPDLGHLLIPVFGRRPPAAGSDCPDYIAVRGTQADSPGYRGHQRVDEFIDGIAFAGEHGPGNLRIHL